MVEIGGEQYFELGQQMYYIAGEGWNDNSLITNRMSEYLFTPLSNSTLSDEDWVKYNVRLEYGGFEACAAAAAKSCGNAGAAPLSGWYINQMYMTGGGNLVKSKLPTDESKIIATDIIHISLDAGNPIMVGVDYPNGSNSSGDSFTDHYVVIYDRGYDENGNAYFKFSENVANNATSGMKNNRRLYLQSDGSFRTNNSNITYNQSQTGGNYTLTGVRLNSYLRDNYKNLINGVNGINY